MSTFWLSFGRFIRVIGSYVRAIARLIIWTIILFFSGLQKALFTRAELVGVDMKLTSFKCDMEEAGEKLAYIDKLCIENPDLIEMSEDYLEDIPFDEDGD